MSTDARTHALRAASEAKRADTLARARRAIVALESRGERINFNSVAAEAKVSTGYLYRQPDLRRAIADRRRSPAQSITASARVSARTSSADAKKLAIATAALKRLHAENQALRKENALLRGDLAQERRRHVR
ncbi:DUF6262 family protein [Luteipulveratus halotolerans]|uniref:DUF6262 family protein n=1 Tax=Luteipulveratus halotolerans TaxID=1631356 RepID=UPI0026D0078C